MTGILTSLHGRKLGLSGKGNLVGGGIDITAKCADASIVVGAKVTNTRAVSIQLKDVNGDNIDYPEAIFAAVFADANPMAAFLYPVRRAFSCRAHLRAQFAERQQEGQSSGGCKASPGRSQEPGRYEWPDCVSSPQLMDHGARR